MGSISVLESSHATEQLPVHRDYLWLLGVAAY